MSEELIYDEMGNITSLKRDNGTVIGYNYVVSGQKSNRLQSLSGGFTGTYTYDVNGNATKDRTGMTFAYNHLNLPKTATKTGTSVSYLYDAMGNKLRKTVTENSITAISEYVGGGIEYSKLGTGALGIDHIATSEGYLTPSGSNYIYHYNLKDHLGNVRSVFKAASATALEIVQKSDYYPFGKRHNNSSYVYNDNRYLYNGKELQDELRGGVHTFGSSYVQEGHYDYGVRFYDAEIGRWNVVDPLAEVQPNKTPYHYTSNNPINRIDPTGMLDEPTPKEAAMMAKHVYGDKKDPGYLIGGWKVSSMGNDLKLSNEDSGFKSGVYERTTNGVTEYTYATAGTDDWNDVAHDVLQPLGMSSQYTESLNNVDALKKMIGGAELTFTGHSLGGGLAENNSLHTGDKAITFNGAGVSPLTSGTFKKPNAVAYIMTTDPLNALQKASALPTAGGNKHYLQPRSASGVYNGHSINSVIDAFSKPTIGQQINNGLRRTLTPPQFRF